jgi:hypothetical protein
MNAIRTALVAVALAASSLAAPVRATAFSTDQSDLWWDPNESGWGIQLVQRADNIAASMYVYDPAGNPTFYYSSMDWVSNSNGVLVWSGDLYVNTGPWFGTVPFNPAAVAPVKVGTMTWRTQSVNAGTLTYSVNGVNVTKNLQRFLTRYDDFSGTYGAFVHADVKGCSDPAGNGTFEAATLFIQITQSGQAVTIANGGTNGNCSYVGNLTQAGQFGQIDGDYSCSTGETGTFTVFELSVNRSGISGRISTQSSNLGCQSTGWFGGGRHAGPNP